MLVDPFRLAIMVVPLAFYLLLLGWINARRKPLLTTGGSDFVALGLALTGVVFIGPLELFRPESGMAQFGNFVWVFLLAMYWLGVWLVALSSRPKLMVYNISVDELRPVVAEAARKLDPTARWAGDSLTLPKIGVQLYLDGFTPMRHVTLNSVGSNQDLEGWRKLAQEMTTTLEPVRVRRNPRSVGMLALATAMLTVTYWKMLKEPQQLVDAINQVFPF